MTLALIGAFRSVSLLNAFAALLAVTTTAGCAGDPFVGTDEQPLQTGGGGTESKPRTTPSGGEAGSGASPSHGGSFNVAGAPGEGGADEGGTGGVGGAAGSAGTGGSGPTPTKYVLIDDIEGAFPTLPERDGRKGGWYAAHDATYGQASGAEAVAFQPASDGNHFAARIGGGGFTGWGAQLGVSLTTPDAPYDASAYCGVRFLAKGGGASWSMLVSDRQSVPQGGVCEQSGSCYRFVGKAFSVEGDWREVVIPFSSLGILGDPNSARRLDSSGIYDILFNFYSAEGAGFELFIDDLSFIEKTSAGCL